MTGSFWEYFLFYGLAGFYIGWLEGIVIPLSKILSTFPRNFGDSFNISGHSNSCPETRLCFFARSLSWDWPVRSRRPPSSKLDFLSLFPLTLRVLLPFLGFWPIIRPLSSSFILSGDSFRLLSLSSISPSLSIRSQSANICWLSFWPEFVTSAARNWPTFLIPLLTVSLWRPVNSNTEG